MDELIISIFALIVSVLTPIGLYFLRRHDNKKDQDDQNEKWGAQKDADDKRDKELSDYNKEIIKIWSSLADIQKEGNIKITNAILEFKDAFIKQKQTEESETFFEKLNENKETMNDARQQKNIVSKKAKRSSVKNKSNEMNQFSKKDKKRHKLSESN